VDGFTTVKARIPVYFLSKDNTWVSRTFLIDTGADVSVIGQSFARQLANFAPYRSYTLGQVSGAFSGQYTVFYAMVDGKTFYLPAVVVQEENYILGRAGFLDHFNISFYPTHFELKPIEMTRNI
jgi:hypothetical protein